MSGSYWLDERRPALPPSRRYARVDVAVVGAGLTGCTAALRLAEGGLSVRVHEAGVVAGGASGRSGGFVLRGGALPYDRAREAYGRDAARELWRWSEAALERLASLAGDALRRTGSLRLAADPAERDAIRREHEALRADGFAAVWHDELPAPLAGFQGAIEHPHDATFHPVRTVRRIAAAAIEAGAELRERDPVASLDALDAERVLLATDGLGGQLLGGLVRPVRNQVLLTEPLARELYPRPHYARHGHAYWQQLADGRLLLGGFRDVAPEAEETDEDGTTPAVQAALESFLRERLGCDARIERRWSGVFGSTEDLLPIAGPLDADERVWVAAGYSGHGNVLGPACGELVADALLGRRGTMQLELLSPARLGRPSA